MTVPIFGAGGLESEIQTHQSSMPSDPTMEKILREREADLVLQGAAPQLFRAQQRRIAAEQLMKRRQTICADLAARRATAFNSLSAAPYGSDLHTERRLALRTIDEELKVEKMKLSIAANALDDATVELSKLSGLE